VSVRVVVGEWQRVVVAERERRINFIPQTQTQTLPRDIVDASEGLMMVQEIKANLSLPAAAVRAL